MKCCVSTDVGTWTNWLTFAPDPDYSPDAGTELLSPISYKRCYAEFYYVGKIPRVHIDGSSLQQGVVINGSIHQELSEQLCRRYMRSTDCALPSALLVYYAVIRYETTLRVTPCPSVCLSVRSNFQGMLPTWGIGLTAEQLLGHKVKGQGHQWGWKCENRFETKTVLTRSPCCTFRPIQSSSENTHFSR